jgi:hypothetical protein
MACHRGGRQGEPCSCFRGSAQSFNGLGYGADQAPACQEKRTGNATGRRKTTRLLGLHGLCSSLGRGSVRGGPMGTSSAFPPHGRSILRRGRSGRSRWAAASVSLLSASVTLGACSLWVDETLSRKPAEATSAGGSGGTTVSGGHGGATTTGGGGQGGSGACELACPAESCCEGACVGLDTSEAHCGACGNTCAATQACCDGQCTGDSESPCCGDLDYPGGKRLRGVGRRLFGGLGRARGRGAVRSGDRHLDWHERGRRARGPARAHRGVDRVARARLGGVANGSPVGGGALYDPVSDSWAPVSNTGAPSSRSGLAGACCRSPSSARARR